MAEKVLLFSLKNDRAQPLLVTLEPIAQDIELAPGETAQAFDAMSDSDFPAEIVTTNDGITVWLNFEGYLLHRGEVIHNHPYERDDAGSVLRLKKLMRDVWTTRGAWKRNST